MRVLRVRSHSQSRNADYGKCPHLYEGKHIRKVQLGEPNEITAIGLESHDDFKTYYLTINVEELWKRSDEDLYDFMIGWWKKQVPDAKMEYISVIQGFTDIECDRITSLKSKVKTLKDFKKYYLPVLIEQQDTFRTKFVYESEDEEVKIRTTFRIRPDAVFLSVEDDSHIIVDWKTGYHKPYIDTDINRQIYIYAHYLEEKKIKDIFGNVINASGMCVVFPRHESVVYKKRDRKSERTILKTLAKYLYLIATGHFERKASRWNCRWDKSPDNQCPLFKLECEECLTKEGFFNDPNAVQAKIGTGEEEDEGGEEPNDEEQDDDGDEEDKDVPDASEGSWDKVEAEGNQKDSLDGE